MKTFKYVLLTLLVSFSSTAVFCQWTDSGSSIYTFDQVGIGLSNPSTNLEILGTSNPSIRMRSSTGEYSLGIANCSGCYSSIASNGDVVLRSQGINSGNLILTARSGDGILFGTGDGNTDYKRMEILNDGKVIIGSVSSSSNNYKLFVQTGILTERVKVAVSTSADWADYVFEKDYKLMSLREVENFIKSNKHLPNVPSAKEVVANGIDMAKMDATLLQKIEELTLYVIEIKKENDALKKQVQQLKSK